MARSRNSRAGSIYIVKPKMHGPEECGFTNRLFDAVEDMLGLARHTIKVGVMDEERRTAANLAACIHAVKDRIVFINTGFLDRTGDEIHTSMQAGPMIRKGEMKASDWIASYEERNVRIGLACGLSGKAQIGKGMWAAPDLMADMLEQKIGHPQIGREHRLGAVADRRDAACAALSPGRCVRAAARDRGRGGAVARPLAEHPARHRAQLVRGRDHARARQQLPGHSGLCRALDRSGRRLFQGARHPRRRPDGRPRDAADSSQALANWLLHGVCTAKQVDAALLRMAAKVDAQNAGDPLYEKLTPDGIAYQAARALIFEGVTQPTGYTEPLLHKFRQAKKAAGARPRE